MQSELLTARQREIFDLIVVGKSNKEIARELGLSEGTVKIHITKLFEKLGVHHRSAVAMAGLKCGLTLSPRAFVQGQSSTVPLTHPCGKRVAPRCANKQLEAISTGA
jgi:DNA-binding CsgD family transcriptional regulator